MKWFSLKEIIKENKKIRWPKKGDLALNSVQTIVFVAFFAIFFVCCQFLVSFLLKLIGVIG